MCTRALEMLTKSCAFCSVACMHGQHMEAVETPREASSSSHQNQHPHGAADDLLVLIISTSLRSILEPMCLDLSIFQVGLCHTASWFHIVRLSPPAFVLDKEAAESCSGLGNKFCYHGFLAIQCHYSLIWCGKLWSSLV